MLLRTLASKTAIISSPAGPYEAEIEEIERVKEFLRRLDEIERKGLSPSSRVDHGVLRKSLRLWIYKSESIGIWRSMPGGSEALGASLFPLFMRDFAPLPKRLANIIDRLERSPMFLDETRSRVRTPVRLWSEIALESTERLPGFLQRIEATGKEHLPGPERQRLSEAVAKSNDSLGQYARWIREDLLPHAEDRIAIGASKFRRLVRLRELGATVEEIHAVGRRYLRASRRELARVAAEIRPGASVEEAKELVKEDHPARFEDALAYTAQAMEDAKRFVVEHDLATIPPAERLGVVETPSYLRHVIPTAAYNSPARFEPRKEGFYMVTPVEDSPRCFGSIPTPGSAIRLSTKDIRATTSS